MPLAGHSRLQTKLLLGTCVVALALVIWAAPDEIDKLTFNCRICGAKRGETRHKLNGFTFWTTRTPPSPPSEVYRRILKRAHSHEWVGGVAYFFYGNGNHADGDHKVPGTSWTQPEYTKWSLQSLAELPVSSELVAWQFHEFVIQCERRGGFQPVTDIYFRKRPRSIDEYLSLLFADAPPSNP